MLRQWMEVAMLYMEYIAYSDERPLGKVKNIWWRHEYQDTMGNLSHIHSLIWLEDEPKCDTQDRIRGSMATLIRPDEWHALVEDGVIDSEQEIPIILNKASRILKHKCSARCKKRRRNDELVCRADNNARMNPTPTRHSVVTMNIRHSEQAEKLLVQMGLFQPNPLVGNATPLHDLLVAKKHVPPARGCEGIISPCNGRLFAAHKSSDNLKQVTTYFAARYLAKYVAGIDENNRVYVGVESKHATTLNVEYQFLHNTKVAGSAIQEEK
jgi:hypothetical protein